MPSENDGALMRIFAQDYALLSPAIDVFTPLIYAKKSGRSANWGRRVLEAAAQYVPTDRKMQLILDYLDYPESLTETAASAHPTWGVQIFGGAKVFADPLRAKVFRDCVTQIRRKVGG
jgi:hypothetical protein